MLRSIYLAFFIISFSTTIKAGSPLIIDHDGGVDDLIATALHIITHAEDIKAITVLPADGYGPPSVAFTYKLWSFFQVPLPIVPIGLGHDEGTNPFPDHWRQDSTDLNNLKIWKDYNVQETQPQHPATAKQVLKKTLEVSREKVDILVTGPLSNIAEVLHDYPCLKDKIKRLYVMGGAFFIKGNVEQAGADGSAEWNIFNQPKAFKDVLIAGVPMTLIPLNATQYTPIRPTFIEKLKQSSSPAARLVLDSFHVIQPFIDNGQYLFWDTLTSAILLDPTIITTQEMLINVDLTGPSKGRTFVDPHGFPVTVALKADQKRFEDTVLKAFIAE
jgi:purine nucleosidase